VSAAPKSCEIYCKTRKKCGEWVALAAWDAEAERPRLLGTPANAELLRGAWTVVAGIGVGGHHGPYFPESRVGSPILWRPGSGQTNTKVL